VTPLLEAVGLFARRGEREVVHAIGFALHGGEAVALVGPNAAGKSTLLRALAGLLRPARGEVRLVGRAITQWPRGEVARALALVAPDEEAPPLLTVGDRARLGRFPHRGPFRPFTDEDRQAVADALERTGTASLAARRLGTLSAGERQLAALARGLAQQPRVLLLDEPGAHLDIGHQLRLFEVLEEVRRSGMAVMAVVHDLQRAAEWAGRMLLLDGGRLVEDGPPDQVLTSAAAARAFGVTVRAHRPPGAPVLYSFEG
jgi:iron complex transport system ATP-binding protein